MCCICSNSLVDKPFGSKEEKIYCGDCYANEFASRCDGCSEVFRPGKDNVKDADTQRGKTDRHTDEQFSDQMQTV